MASTKKDMRRADLGKLPQFRRDPGSTCPLFPIVFASRIYQLLTRRNSHSCALPGARRKGRRRRLQLDAVFDAAHGRHLHPQPVHWLGLDRLQRAELARRERGGHQDQHHAGLLYHWHEL